MAMQPSLLHLLMAPATGGGTGGGSIHLTSLGRRRWTPTMCGVSGG